MNDTKRTLLFLVGCIGSRLGLAYVAKRGNERLLVPVAVAIGIGFLLLYAFQLRPTGIEAGGKIWWDSLRPIHGVLYLLYAVYAYRGESWSWYFLLVDALVGLMVRSIHRS